MKIAILGAGFTGLAAGLRLLQQGNEVTIFEKDSTIGGLAVGFKDPSWDWSLESAYHHWFTSDNTALHLAKELNQPVIIKRPITSVYINGQILPFDSPQTILSFPYFSLTDKLRTGLSALFLKLINNSPKLAHQKAVPWVKRYMGENSYNLIWDPLFSGKFDGYKDDIALSWFWARIKKRTPSLAYPEGGFQCFADRIAWEIKKTGGQILLDTAVSKIEQDGSIYKILLSNGDNLHNNSNRASKETAPLFSRSTAQTLNFDKVVSTLPSPVLTKIAPQLPKDYVARITSIPHLHAQVLVLRTKKPFLNKVYWLNITDKSFPFLVVVDHTNFMDPTHYNNEHLIYIGNYLPSNHPFLKLSADQLLDKFDPYLQQINPSYRSSIISSHLFTAPFAQPVVTTNYQSLIPTFKSPLQNLFIANMDMVYPWDRGTNYALEMGQTVASLINNS